MSITPERLRELIRDHEDDVAMTAATPYPATVDTLAALRDYERLRGDREPPHCKSCTCGEHILGPEGNGNGNG